MDSMDRTDRRTRLLQAPRCHTRLSRSMVLALVLLVLATSVVSATTLTMSATDAPSVTVTLNGTDQTAADPFIIDVKDTRSVNDGWKLQITSTQFSTGGASPKTLSTTAASITGVSATCDVSPCTDPVNGTTYPVPVPAGATAPASVAFFNAASLTGIGDFTITPTFQVRVPANAYAGSYNSTLTITIASGP